MTNTTLSPGNIGKSSIILSNSRANAPETIDAKRGRPIQLPIRKLICVYFLTQLAVMLHQMRDESSSPHKNPQIPKEKAPPRIKVQQSPAKLASTVSTEHRFCSPVLSSTHSKTA